MAQRFHSCCWKTSAANSSAGGPIRRALRDRIFGCGCQNRFGISFWLVGEFTNHFRTYFSGDWDVYWGYDLAFDLWQFLCLDEHGHHLLHRDAAPTGQQKSHKLLGLGCNRLHHIRRTPAEFPGWLLQLGNQSPAYKKKKQEVARGFSLNSAPGNLLFCFWPMVPRG